MSKRTAAVVGPMLAALALVLPGSTACVGLGDCSCPATGIWPLVTIELPCADSGGAVLPTMTLTGVCEGTGGEQSGQLVFGANDAGSCHVELTYPDGTTVSADVQFDGTWLACGTDAHGCGQQLSPVGLSSGYPATLVIGGGCADGGGPDGATE